MIQISPQQLAQVLTTACNLRTDVKKATVKIAEDDPAIMLVDISFYTEGPRRQMETRVKKCLDGRSCGEIIDGWLNGPPPAVRGAVRPDATLVAQRELYRKHRPDQVISALKHQRANPPEPPPRSKFDWNAPRPTADNPSGIMKAQVPEQPVESTKQPEEIITQIDDDHIKVNDKLYRHFVPPGPYCPIEGDRLFPNGIYTRVMTRQEMITLGMDEARRAEQYKRQRGKHPDDITNKHKD